MKTLNDTHWFTRRLGFTASRLRFCIGWKQLNPGGPFILTRSAMDGWKGGTLWIGRVAIGLGVRL